MPEAYLIPSQTVRTELVVDKSRFITTVALAPSVDSARSFIQSIRAEMPDASHYVYAFRIGFGNSVIEGMSDDGEPSGTSGPPTLAVISGSEIGDIVMVTTRYFGGKKLGTGGLVRAYTSAAQKALNSLKLELKQEKLKCKAIMPYTFYERTRLLLDRYSAIIIDESFTSEVTLEYQILKEHHADIKNELAEMSAGTIQIQCETI